jgi:hypothetical protein
VRSTTYLIIPDLHRSIVRAGQNVRLVPGGVVIHAIHPALVSLQRVMGHVRPQPPNLDGSIQRRTGKGVGVLGIDLHLHHVVRMSLKHLRAIKAPVPVPELDGHVIGR